MVDYKKIFRILLAKSNEKQKHYMSNLFGVSGGAVMYTVWQTMTTEQITVLVIVKAISMLLLSVLLILAGYRYLEGK